MIHICDFHCDTITRLKQGNEGLYVNTGHIDIQRLRRFSSPLLTFAVCLDGEGKECFRETMDYIDYFREELEKNKQHISLVTTYNDIVQNKKEKKISALLTIEGGEAFEGKLENIKKLYDAGVRIVTLTWNNQNELGHGVLSESNTGLTSFGLEALKQLARYNMLVDVSHLNEAGFWDVANTIQSTFVATHSNCRTLCDHPRNLTDKQIVAIAERNGLIGINLFPDFIRANRNAHLADVLEHIHHIVRLVGVNYVCLGSDFDGVQYLPKDVSDIRALLSLRKMLLRQYSAMDSEAILSGNILRFLKKFLV